MLQAGSWVLFLMRSLGFIIYQTNLDLRDVTLGYGFHFQHGNPRTLPIESFEHGSGHGLVRAENSYPKGSPNTESAATALNTALPSAHTENF
jgi:hypothetical protein